MCLILDDREHDSLRRALAPYDLAIEVCRLEYGDIAWEGRGPRAKPVLIGIERKRLPDLIASMTDRRLAGHQLRGMYAHYDYCYLLIEGMWRPAIDGSIETLQSSRWLPLFSRGAGVNYRQVDSYLSSLEIKGRVIVCRSANVAETAALLSSRYHWWQKRFEDHHAHDQIFTRDPLTQLERGKALSYSREPGLVEKIAAQLSGIDRKAWDVGRRFKTVEAMVAATEREWMEVPGIGKTIAGQVVKELRGMR